MTKKTKKSADKTEDFDFRTIKTFEDACNKLHLDSAGLPELSAIPEDLRKPLMAVYRLFIIFQALNNGWEPDWSDSSQYKYYPWYWVLSSGFGFLVSRYYYDRSSTHVGSRLCTDSSEKALYIAEQFKEEYQDFFLYSK